VIAVCQALEGGASPATLVLAVRGHRASGAWAEAVGPEDPVLARLTDPASLRATLVRRVLCRCREASLVCRTKSFGMYISRDP
jgi:hypothetical protein